MTADPKQQLSALILRLFGRAVRSPARQIGVAHTTLSLWRDGRGVLDYDSLRKLRDYLKCSISNLDDYLEGRISLDELLSGTKEIPRSRWLIQILEWLPLMEADEVLQVAGVALQVLSQILQFPIPRMSLLNSAETSAQEKLEDRWIDPAPKEPKTIAALISVELQNRPEAGIDQLAEDTGLSVERLQQLQAGDRPTAPEVCDLALGLRRQPDIYWLEEELWQIRVQQFGRNKNGDATEASNGETSVK